MGMVRRCGLAMAWAVLAGGCGPTQFPNSGESSGGWLTSALPSDGVQPSGGDTWGLSDSSSTTADNGGLEGVEPQTTTGSTDTGEIEWLFDPGDTRSRPICNANGTVRLVIETLTDAPLVGCEFGPGANFDTLLAFVIEEWDGGSGSHLVHQDADTFGIFAGEFLVGAIELTVSEPFIVDRLFMEVGNEQATFVGYVDLAACASAEPPLCGGA